MTRLLAGVFGLAIVSGCSCASSSAGSATPTPASTWPGAAPLEKARSLADRGQFAAASDELAEAQRLLGEAAPLRVLGLTLLASAPVGYGIYDPMPGSPATLTPRDPLILYFEPAGFARKNADGKWSTDLSADITLLAPPSPEPFLSTPDFVKSVITSRRPNGELYFVATLHVEGVPEGTYAAQIRLNDKIGGESATASIPFRIKLTK